MIGFVRVPIGSGECVRCTRCHPRETSASYDAADVVAARVAEVVSSWRGGPGPNVELCGAEPFRHPELPAVVGATVQAGVRRLRLATDAAALASANNAAGAMSAGVRHLSFTLLGGTNGIHDVLAGEPGALDATLAGVRTFREIAAREEVAVDVLAVVRACRHNMRDLPEAAGTAVTAGADTVLVLLEDGGADVAEALPWLTAACDTGVMNGVWVEVSGVPFCLLPGYELHVSDVVRGRRGTHGPSCAACALVECCAGGPEGMEPRLAGALRPPASAEHLAARIRHARGGETADA